MANKINLTLKYKGRIKDLDFDTDEIIIGRSESLKACVKDCTTLSREHLKISLIGDDLFIEDLNSRNGTYLDGIKIKAFAKEKINNQNIKIGSLDNYVEVTGKVIAITNTNLNIEKSKAASTPPVQEIKNELKEDTLIRIKKEEIKTLDETIQSLKSTLTNRESDLTQLKSEIEKIKELNEKNINIHKANLASINSKIEENEKANKELEEREKNNQIKINEQLELIKKNNLLIEQSKESLETWKSKQNAAKQENEYLEEQNLKKLEKLKNEELNLNNQFIQLNNEYKIKTEDTKKEFDDKILQLKNENNAKIETLSEEFNNFKIKNNESIELKQKEYEQNLKSININLNEATKLHESKLESLDNILVEKEKITNIKINELEDNYNKKLKQFNYDTENLESELKLLRSKIETEKEGFQKDKYKLERENQIILDKKTEQEKHLESLNEKKKKFEHQFDDFKLLITDHKNTISNLETEKNQLKSDIEQAKEQFIELEEINKNKILNCENKIKENIEKFELDISKKKKIIHDENEAQIKAWKEEYLKMREADLKELRLLKTNEELKVQKLLSESNKNLANHISSKILANKSPTDTITISSLLNILQTELENAFSLEAKEIGILNPNLKHGTRKFWIKTAVAASICVLSGYGIMYGPKFLSNKITIWKSENKQENINLMNEIRLQREKMLALHLESKENFQETYVDNVLYNDGYLEMKLNENTHKEWTIALSKFFLDELLFDDRKLVDFIPIEKALILNLSDTYKILNAKNFDANLIKMKSFEQAKNEEMWILLGGKDNWIKLRQFENKFYTQHLSTKESRVPATSNDSK